MPGFMAIVLLILYIFNRRSRVQSAREAALLLRPNRTRENGIEDVSGQEVPFEASGCVLRTKSLRDIPYGVIKQDSFPLNCWPQNVLVFLNTQLVHPILD